MNNLSGEEADLHSPQKGQYRSIFWTLMALSAFFLLMQVSLLIPNIKVLIKEIISGSNSMHFPLSIFPGLLAYFGAHLLLWLLLIIGIIGQVRLIGPWLKLGSNTLYRLALLMWVFLILLILCANQLCFPRSAFSEVTDVLFGTSGAIVGLYISSIFLGFFVLLSFYRVVSISVKQYPKISIMVGVVFLSAVIWCTLVPRDENGKGAASKARPNIILIGIDSLRPDFVGFYGGYEKLTPNVDTFLEKATSFTNATTPMARTFPAWISILTGMEPIYHGARYDLINPNKILKKASMAFALKEKGYHTAYASDEFRFSNIDAIYGFDTIIGPKIGFNDFIVGGLNDFPLVNIVINTPVGKCLFPYNYANRAAHLTYKAKTFDELLEAYLKTPRDKPVYLALHYCLSHWPYVTAKTPPLDNSLTHLPLLRKLYRDGIVNVDKQFKVLMDALKKHHYLDHSVVVVLSDHGEALAWPGDRVTEKEYYIKSINKESAFFKKVALDKKADKRISINQTVGHGTDALSLSQNQVVLAFRYYGLSSKNVVKNFSFLSSLMDIAPTLYQLLDIKSKYKMQGVSLAKVINGKKKTISDRSLFTETGFSPDSVIANNPSLKTLIDLWTTYFAIDADSSRMLFRDDMGQIVISQKQHAQYYKHWILAKYPSANGDIAVLVDLKSKAWTDDLTTPWARKSPITLMLKRMKSHYKSEYRPIQVP